MTRDLVRDDVVLSSKTWVVKVGTSVLTGTLMVKSGPGQDRPPGRTGLRWSPASGRRVALVSSGAVGAGLGQLGLAEAAR